MKASSIVLYALILSMVFSLCAFDVSSKALTPPPPPPGKEFVPKIVVLPGVPVKQPNPLVMQPEPKVNPELQGKGEGGAFPNLVPPIFPEIHENIREYAVEHPQDSLMPIAYWWLKSDGGDNMPRIYWINPTVTCEWYSATVTIRQWGTGKIIVLDMEMYVYDWSTNTCWWRPKNSNSMLDYWWAIISAQINTNPPIQAEIDPNYVWLGVFNFLTIVHR